MWGGLAEHLVRGTQDGTNALRPQAVLCPRILFPDGRQWHREETGAHSTPSTAGFAVGFTSLQKDLMGLAKDTFFIILGLI